MESDGDIFIFFLVTPPVFHFYICLPLIHEVWPDVPWRKLG